MPMFSSQIQQQVYMSQMALAAQQQNANLLAMQMGTLPMQGGMMPPMMPRMGLSQGMDPGMSGMYGEQLASRMNNAGRTAMGIGGVGLGVAGALTGLPLDPFSAAIGGARLGFGMAGIGGAVAGGAMAALPFYAATKAAGVYTGAFSEGMQEQVATNSMLRNRFNFQGGGGAMGRGFSQGQMGAIGQMISAETRKNPFNSSQEINDLIANGSEIGMFNAVRDVETFGKRFRSMMDGLRKIQKELGGTLSDALQFSRGSQQLGIFSNESRTAFAANMRDTMATTGMDQNQLMNLAATGAMLSRATGGVGRQGATGALRTARTLGSALQVGAINRELLSEATGGLQGDEAIQAFTARTLQMSDRFSRSARGRYSMFALANEDATGLDEGMLARFQAGDISVGEVMRGANRRVNRVGRARALNREGKLRGAMMEEGGMSGQIGMMRLLLGERVADSGDDMAQLVMQRRFGFSQQEAQVWTGLMRNQGTIAANESVEKAMGKRQVERETEIATHRSLEAFAANLTHGMQDSLGVTRVRELGKKFTTRVSAAAERVMNDFLGVAAEALSPTEQRSITRLGMGMATREDRDRINLLRRGGGRMGYAATGSEGDPFADTTANRLAHAFGAHTPATYGAMMRGRGVDIRSMDVRQRWQEENRRVLAQEGVLRDPTDIAGLKRLNESRDETILKMMRAQSTGGGRDAMYAAFGAGSKEGVSAAAIDAFAHQNKINLPEQSYMRVLGATQLSDVQQRRRTDTMIGYGSYGALAGGAVGSVLGSVLGPIGTYVGAVGGAAVGGAAGGALGAMQGEFWTDQEKAADFIARGGHAAKAAARLRNRDRVRGGGALRVDEAGMTQGEAKQWMQDLAGKDIDRDVMKGVLEGEDFRASVARLRELGGGRGTQQEINAELAIMSQRAMNMPEQQGRAAERAIKQLDYSMKTGKKMPGKEWGVSANEEARYEEYTRHMARMSGQYDKLAGALPEGSLKNLFGAAAGAFAPMSSSAGPQADPYASVNNIVDSLAKMTPEERAKYTDALGKEEEGRGLMLMAAQQNRAVRELSGGGRRGHMGARDAALSMLTGNAIGGMEFSLGEGKQKRYLDVRNQSQVIARAFAQGGKEADSLALQLADQMKGQGIQNAEQYVQRLQGYLKDGKLSPKEAEDFYKEMRDDKDVQRVQREGYLANQKQNDPLGVERNDILKQIKTGIGMLVRDKTGEDIPVEQEYNGGV